MQNWAGKKLISFQLSALRRADPRPLLLLDGRYVERTFRGEHSWFCVRGRDCLVDDLGEGAYEIRCVIWTGLRSGLLREYEVYEDTRRVVALEKSMANTWHPAAGAVAQ